MFWSMSILIVEVSTDTRPKLKLERLISPGNVTSAPGNLIWGVHICIRCSNIYARSWIYRKIRRLWWIYIRSDLMVRSINITRRPRIKYRSGLERLPLLYDKSICARMPAAISFRPAGGVTPVNGMCATPPIGGLSL